MLKTQKAVSSNREDSPYTNLANAIVLQAVKDYRGALKRLVKHPDNEAALSVKNEVEHFLRSDWYMELTSIDPEMLIRKLNQEVK